MGLRRGPDRKSFRLDHGSRRDQVKLLGNGVCAPVMERVVRSLTADMTLEDRRNARRTLRRDDFSVDDDIGASIPAF